MSNSAFQFASPEILTKLASIKPYVLVVLTKGENYVVKRYAAYYSKRTPTLHF